MRLVIPILGCLIGSTAIAHAAPPAAASPATRAIVPSAVEIKTASWWVEQARAELGTVTNADWRASATADLADLQLRVGDHLGFVASVNHFLQWAATARTPQQCRIAAVSYAYLSRAYGRLGHAAGIAACIDGSRRFYARSEAKPSSTNQDKLIVTKLVEVGRFDEATALATGQAEPQRRRSCLEPVTRGLVAAGRHDEARRALAVAEAAARQCFGTKHEDEPHDELGYFALELIFARETAWAERVIAELPEAKRGSLYADLAAHCFDAGDREGYTRNAARAFAAFKARSPQTTGYEDIARLAGLQHFAGDAAAADRTLALVKTDGKPEIGMVDFHLRIALNHARRGNVPQVRESLEAARLAEKAEKAGALGGLLGEMRAMLGGYANIAKALIDRGHTDEAVAILKSLDPDSANAASVKGMLAFVDASAGRLEAVKRLVEEAEPGPEQNLLRYAAVQSAARGADAARLFDLLKWVQSFEAGSDRATGYSAVADVLAGGK